MLPGKVIAHRLNVPVWEKGNELNKNVWNEDEKTTYSCPIHGRLENIEAMYIQVDARSQYRSERRCVKCVIKAFEDSFVKLDVRHVYSEYGD